MNSRADVQRISSIDFTRGLVMVIMALDHVRDLMHVDSITQSPTDLSTTTPVLFFTRWITHLCAPIFVCLAGTSVYLSFKKQNNLKATRRFLLTRGLWLIVLEFTLVNFAIFFNWKFNTLLFEVIAAIGFGFIVLSLLLKVSPKVISLIGLLIIACHNLFPFLPLIEGSIAKIILTPLFNPAAIPLTSKTVMVMAYPPIPWLGIMLVGFSIGRFFEWEPAKRKSLFLKLGIGSLLLFVALRFINVYGDTVPWSVQKSSVYTFLSFMNVTKYPPSLLFCLVTLGIMFLVLAVTERLNNQTTSFFTTYGKVPLFYFLVHFYLIHTTLLVLLLAQGFDWSQLEFATGTFGRPAGVVSGVGLLSIYVIWILIVLALYKPCQWYGRYKASHKQAWLKYL